MKGGAQQITRGQALPGVYEKIVSFLENCAVTKVLDAPSGFGVLAELLKKRGYDIVSLDIACNKYTPRDKKLVISDLTEGIPFRDDSFDAVLCIEGIEHLYNPLILIRETHRILRKGGYLVLTTPNVVNIRSRIKFLLRGELYWFDETAISRYGHISPQLPFVLESFLSKTGFTILSIAGNKNHTLTGLVVWTLFQPFELIKKNKMNAMKYWGSGALIYLCEKTA